MADDIVNPDLVDPNELRKRQIQLALASTPPSTPTSAAPQDYAAFNAPPQGPNAVQAYQAYLGQEPKLSEYHPSTARRIGSILAGVGTGLMFRNPFVGAKMAQQVEYGPFTQKEREFQQQLAQKKTAAEVESSEETRQAQEAELGARRGAEQARSEAEGARRKYLEGEQRSLVPGTPEFQGRERITQLQHPDVKIPEVNDMYSFELPDGSKVTNATRVHDKANSQFYYVTDNGQAIDPAAIKPGSLTRTPRDTGRPLSTSIAIKRQQYKDTHNNQEPPAELVDQWQAEDAKARETPALKGQREASAALNVKRAEGATPQEILNFQTFAHAHPEQAMDYAKGYSDIKRRDLLASVPISAIPPAADKALVDAAQITLGHAKQLREIIQDPQIQANLGPILGRIQDVEGNWGGNPTGLVDPEKEQMLLSYIKMNMLREARLLGGNRPAWQVINMLKTSSPSAKQVYSRFLGALDAEEAGAQRTMEGILQGNAPEKQKPTGFKVISRSEEK